MQGQGYEIVAFGTWGFLSSACCIEAKRVVYKEYKVQE
jgi:hypothetical protein